MDHSTENRCEAGVGTRGGATRPERSTTDFVHYVMHFAANKSGQPCDVCAGRDPIRYA